MDELTSTIRAEDRERWWGIHDKDDYVCPDCHRTPDEVDGWEVHHINAVPHNIVGLCGVCHSVRHGAKRSRIDLETWKEEFAALGD